MKTELYETVICGNIRQAEALAKKELKAGADPARLMYDVIIPAMEEVGRRFECSEYFVPELLISTRAATCAMEVLRPALVRSGRKITVRAITGCVAGELHDIGIRID